MPSMTYEQFFGESCYRQFTRGFPVIAALTVACFAAIPLTPQQYRMIPGLYAGNGLVLSVATLAALLVIRSHRALAVGGALLLGIIYLADILAFEDITCSFLKIPFSPVYVVGYMTLILLAMHQRSNPNARSAWFGVLALSLVFALASGGMEFVDLLSLTLTRPIWWMVIAKLVLAAFPVLLISTVHSVAIEGFKEQLQEVRRTNEKLMSSMRYIICGEIFGTLVHDFRNTVGEVHWAVQRLRTALSRSEGTPAVDDVIQALNRSTAVSEQFIAYLRMDPHVVGTVDVPAVLKSVLSFAQNCSKLSRDVQFVTDFPEVDPIHVHASEYRLFSVFLNIVVNALQSLAGSNQELKSVKASVRAGAATVNVTISDNGPGIDKDILPLIFTVFSTKSDGGGLGLHLVWRYIVDELGGTIRAYSTPFEETGFCISLRPTTQDSHSSGASRPGMKEPSASRGTA